MRTLFDCYFTPRLYAERPTTDHFHELLELYQDHHVMSLLTGRSELFPEDSVRRRLLRVARHWDRNGFGSWIFRDRLSGQFVGRGGLHVFDRDQPIGIELLYAIVSDRWGEGLATEIAQASLKIGFDRLGISEVTSWILPFNRRSQRVLEKLGFHDDGECALAGIPHRRYLMHEEDWRAAPHDPGSLPGQIGMTPGPLDEDSVPYRFPFPADLDPEDLRLIGSTRSTGGRAIPA